MTAHLPARPHARDRDQRHRASTPLELLFDLCFVVAVAQAGTQLHHALGAGHAVAGLVGYVTAFVALWWAWMGFTWFASGYDTDDVWYRLLTAVIIAGSLVLAAGVPAAFDGDFTTATVGYVVMRVGLVGQWGRVALRYPPARTQAVRYVVGISICQAGWLARLALPHLVGLTGPGLAVWALLVAAELSVPVWAERAPGARRWHPDHIAERYGLFALIVLGESVAAATVAVQQGIADHGVTAGLLWLAVGALLLVLGEWWLYFDHPAGAALRAVPRLAFRWGYGHFAVFAALAAVGAGLQVAADTTGHDRPGARTAALAVAVPVAGYLLVLGWLQRHLGQPHRLPLGPLLGTGAAAVLAVGLLAPAPPLAVLLIGLVVAALVAACVLSSEHHANAGQPDGAAARPSQPDPE